MRHLPSASTTHPLSPAGSMKEEHAEERGESWLPRYGGLISSEWEFAKGLQVLQEAPAVYAAARRTDAAFGAAPSSPSCSTARWRTRSRSARGRTC